MLYPDLRILIFAKAPEPGYVKTRLIPALGAEGAADLYRGLLERTVEQVTAAMLCPVQLWCAPNTDHPLFQQLASRNALVLYSQTGNDLGERMYHAVNKALQEAKAVLLVGADCPLLDSAYLNQALGWLMGDEDAVLGPAEDGGYVLLGLKRNERNLFHDMPWGKDQVLRLTRKRMKGLGWRWRELEVLWDMDRPLDIERWEQARKQ